MSTFDGGMAGIDNIYGDIDAEEEIPGCQPLKEDEPEEYRRDPRSTLVSSSSLPDQIRETLIDGFKGDNIASDWLIGTIGCDRERLTLGLVAKCGTSRLQALPGADEEFFAELEEALKDHDIVCLLYTSPSPRDRG